MESLNNLADSIKMYGVIQPIIVTDHNGFYEIVAGERRWRAAKIAGLNEIPAIIRENNVQKNKEIALIENVQRQDLNPIEKAEGMKALIDEYKLTQEEVGRMLGISRSGVANTIRILNLDKRVLEFVKEGKLSEGHARSLLAFENPEQQYRAAVTLIQSNGTCRDIERKVSRVKNPKMFNPKYEMIYKDIEDTFQGFFGTKVRVDAGKRSGKIVIEYRTNNDLERILDLLK